jgi:hypothetical protein
MPTNENNNQNPTNESTSSSQDAAAGDILEQLKADSATDANLYKLGLRMQKSVTNMDKNLTKQQKVINQAKKNLDSVTAAVTSMSKDSAVNKTTLTSIDTSIKQLFSLLEKVQEANDSIGKSVSPLLTETNDNLKQIQTLLAQNQQNPPPEPSNPGEGGGDSVLSSIDTNIDDILTILKGFEQNGIPGAPGGGPGSTLSGVDESSSSANAGIRLLEQRIAAFEAQLRALRQNLDSGAISQTEYTQQTDSIRIELQQAYRTLREANESLANYAQQYDSYITAEDRLRQNISQLTEQFARNQITQDEFNERLSQLKGAFDSHRETLSDMEAAWKDDGKFSFAKQGKEFERKIDEKYEAKKADLIDRFERGVPDENGNVMDNDAFTQAMNDLMGERATEMANTTGLGGLVTGVEAMTKVGTSLDKFIDDFSHGRTYNTQTGENHTAAAAMNMVGEVGGTLAGAEVGAAIGTAIGGPVGTVVGGIIGDLVGSKIEALTSIIGDRLDYLANHSKKTRDEILQAGLNKIRNDVKDMATYSIEIYETSTKNIYDAWDKNLSQITATQGYTKEALNSLQDAVAQRLQDEGYGTTINAADYLDSLANTLTANLGGKLAEAFAAQNLILQKAVPEVDLSQSAAQFAAIYANANKQTGQGEDTMIAAMNEIAGAAKALETVTEGNNQFLKETGNLLTKATEVVQIAGGNADQISGLTTQMMASEAAITSVAPQLSGFTSELVTLLMNNNDATAVSLRAIMNDMNSNIGVSATSFMKSFMDDTQGTLSTAFAAIQKFIDQNENEASRQEFLQALESVFGVQGSKLAQIDFGGVSDLISQVSTSVNMAALTNAENLVRGGETTSLEEQLVANTTNQLLATNAISTTIDNKLMRKLETNELAMERLVYSAQATQSVELAENTLSFFTKISDLIMSILDPFGLFDMFTTSINAATSAAVDAERYLVTSTMSSIGSTVADGFAGAQNAFANTVGGATAVMSAATTKSTDAMVFAVEANGVTDTFEGMMSNYAQASREAQAAIAQSSAESNAISYASMEQQAKQSSEYKQKQTEAQQQDAKYEEDKAAAREQQKAQQQEEDLRNIENHDNIVIIKDYLDTLDMSDYLQPILEEHRTHTEQIKELQATTTEVVKLLSTMIEYQMVTSPEFASTISYDERSRIMDNGYVTATVPGFF